VEPHFFSHILLDGQNDEYLYSFLEVVPIGNLPLVAVCGLTLLLLLLLAAQNRLQHR